jgi:hypothetical protein
MDDEHATGAGSSPASGGDADGLAERVGSHLESKFRGQVQCLQVVCSDGQLILRGRTRTYHVRHLAQQAVLDLTEGYPLLINQISVS